MSGAEAEDPVPQTNEKPPFSLYAILKIKGNMNENVGVQPVEPSLDVTIVPVEDELSAVPDGFLIDLYAAWVDKKVTTEPPANYSEAMKAQGFKNASVLPGLTKERFKEIRSKQARSDDKFWVVVSVYCRPPNSDRNAVETKKFLEGTLL